MGDAVVARFVERSSVTVMTRLTLQRAISTEWVDAVFEAHRERQYTRELLFSTVVDLMGLVALGLRPSLHAAAQRAFEYDGTKYRLPGEGWSTLPRLNLGLHWHWRRFEGR